MGGSGLPRGGVLVIHENRGLTDSIRTIAGRLAGSGYSALAIDLLSEEGGTASFSDEFEAMAALERHRLAVRGGHEGGGDGRFGGDFPGRRSRRPASASAAG